MSYILKITTESYLLTGSGEGAALIDADVVFHPTGFPMIPARRVKGMLKESLEEVMEIFGKPRQEIDDMVGQLFGVSGTSTYQGKLLFHNLMHQGWNSILAELGKHPNHDAFKPDFIKSYFTTEVQQTAIGRENRPDEIEGVAKKRSLRNYRVIKPGQSFEAPLELTIDLTEEEREYLEKAVFNLRHAGTRRNRGFGKIKCQLETPKPDIGVQTNKGTGSKGSPTRISVSVSTLAPVVLAELQGEQNTVFTRKYISGNQLRGLLANAYMRSQGLTFQNAHLDPGFQDLFLSGKLKFGDMQFRQGRAIPLHLHKYKQDADKMPISVFAKGDTDENNITKPIKGIGQVNEGSIQTEGFIPKTTFNFHNSRPNRAAGRNTESDAEGGIFYYESLNEGQAFHGEITGDAASLNKLLNAFPASFQARMGRSRSAQYGSVEVSLKGENQSAHAEVLQAGEYVLTLESPLILLNEWGFPSPTVGELKNELFRAWGVKVKVNNAAAAFTNVEQFNGVWRSKSGQVVAFQEGSSFLIEVPSEVKEASDTLGEWTEQGFGKIKKEPFAKEQSYIIEKSIDSRQAKSDDDPNILPDSAILKELKKAYESEDNKLDVKKRAIGAANEFKSSRKRITNHLIGRLEQLFERRDSAQQIYDWIKEIKDKPAGDALKKVHLVNFDHQDDQRWFNLDQFHNMDGDWDAQKLFWTTFFQTLRKLNKKDDKKQ